MTTIDTQSFEGLHEWFRSMRETSPVIVDTDQPIAQVFGYQDCFTVLTEYADFSSEMDKFMPDQDDFKLFSEGNFIRMDPPEHKNLRGLISKVFTPKMIAGLEPRIAEITDEMLAEAGTDFDLVDTLAYPLPVIVIAEMLGIPTSDRPLFRRWADVMLSQQTDEKPSVSNEKVFKAIAPAMREMNEYLLAHIKERRANPGDDLTSLLITAEADGRKLTDTEIVGFVGVLLIAGHITTTALLGNSIIEMNNHPDVFTELRAERELIPNAVEEFLRFRSPFPRAGRRTTRAIELGGVTIPENHIVFVWMASANRDPHQFSEPDTLDIHRSPNHHLSFAKGIHFCIGAPLARLEARVALDHLLDRYRHLEISGPGEFFPPMTMAAAKRLPMAGSLA